MTPTPKLSRQQTKVRNALRARATPIAPKRYIISERQLAEAFEEWSTRLANGNSPATKAMLDAPRRARYLLDLIAELAADYARANT